MTDDTQDLIDVLSPGDSNQSQGKLAEGIVAAVLLEHCFLCQEHTACQRLRRV